MVAHGTLPELYRLGVAKLAALEKEGKLKRIPFEERDAMKKLTDPVMAAYAKEIGADGIYAKIVALN